ncbi:hypothetical protein A6R68_08952 [Neotoma lepida]|uniref:Uncharacterized protein n=1 Tax=Neotoma lepida TaxID=56216 RepID=A0A1A6G171_NEOLE|nr:hypothetical protein A6R68_08952 [Neotoma lepida]
MELTLPPLLVLEGKIEAAGPEAASPAQGLPNYLLTVMPGGGILGQEGLNWAQVVHVGVSGQRLPFRLQAADTQEEILAQASSEDRRDLVQC